MKIVNFDIYADLLKEKSGLSLSHDKSYLLESRLSSIAKKHGYESVEDMASGLQGVPKPDMVTDIVEAMTTNETFFFRDTKPFDIFKNICMPYFEKARTSQKKLRIWSAAASSGQEAYSLSMILREAQNPWMNWNIDILATDLSNDILEIAKNGNYSQFEVQRGLPIKMLMSYFTQEGDRWTIKPEIRSMVNFKQFNLLNNPASLGMFDIIFCRNVLIYFDAETKGKVFKSLSNQLAPDGYLFLGGAETVLGLTDEFKPVPGQRGLYAKTNSQHVSEAA